MAICNTLFNPNCTTNPNPVTYTSNAVQTIITWLLAAGVIFFLYEAIMAGYHFISSQGDAKKLEEARSRITNAFLGIAVVFTVFVFLKLLGIMFGIPSLYNLQLILPTL